MPFKNVNDFCGILDFRNYAITWFTKWQYNLNKLGFKSKIDRFLTWSTENYSREGTTRYNLRSSTVAQSNLTVKNQISFGEITRDLSPEINDNLVWLKGREVNNEILIVKFELKKRNKAVRVYKILDDDRIRQHVERFNADWYRRRIT